MTPRDGQQPAARDVPHRAAGATPHDVFPETALTAIRAFDGPVLIDLDETLYLRNSTEDFIDSARPAIVAAALLEVLDWIGPWRWTGGDATRENWRVRLVLLLFPWTAGRWRQRVSRLVEQHGNGALADAVRAQGSRPVVFTRGFRSIAMPLIAAFHLGESAVVAARTERFDERRRDTLGLAVDALGADTVQRALVITDCAEDLPLLGACARPLRTLWPGAQCRAAFSNLYFPGRYLTRISHAGERGIARTILQEDFAFWLLGSVGLAALPMLHVAGLLFLLISFWTIYECGYVDSDRIAASNGATVLDASVPTPRWDPWIWALITGAIAIELLRWPAGATLADCAIWTAALLTTHVGFLIYNRLDPLTRVWPYAGLQLARSAVFVTLVPVAAVGAAALGAHVLARWMCNGMDVADNKDRPVAPLPLVRLLFFIVLAVLLARAQGLSTLFNWTAAALLGWNLVLARNDVRAAVLRARRVGRRPAHEGP